MRILNLDHLNDGTIQGLSRNVGAFLCEAAIVCLIKNGHRPGVNIEVKGTFIETFQIHWQPQIQENTFENWRDLNEAVEYGATALAILLIDKLTDFTFFGRAAQMEVADYLLVRKGGTPDFEDANPGAYLEVSGIFKETKGNTLSIRTNIKKRHLKQDRKNNVPGFVIVVEFNIPKVKISKI